MGVTKFGSHDIDLVQGRKFAPSAWTYTDSAGTPINLTGYTARMEIREKAGGALILAFSTTDPPPAGEGTITLGGAAGTILLLADNTLTANLKPGPGKFELIINNESGDGPETLLMGNAMVHEKIVAD